MASLSPAAAASPKRLRVYSSAAADGAGSGKRVGTHNGSFHCDEALGCFLIRLTSQFAGADVVRTRDSQVPSSLPSLPFIGRVLPLSFVVASEGCLCLGLWGPWRTGFCASIRRLSRLYVSSYTNLCC